MFARVRVQGTESYDAIMIPDDAVGTDQTNKFALVVAEDGTVSRKILVLGPVLDGLRVIREGLTKDDVVVIKGLQRARAGSKVAFKEEAINPNAGVPPPRAGLTAPVQPPAPELAAPASKSATGPVPAGVPPTKKQ
jgi:hypothetical protein